MAECTLGVKYRREHADGTVSGGPMYYLQRRPRGAGRGAELGKVPRCGLRGLHASAVSLGGGNMFQSNQATAQIIERHRR